MLKSPFHSNSMETDPMVYGLRPIIIKIALTELFNDKSILITGARGIGKSSLSYQLQRILNGNEVILTRCGLDNNLSNYIIIDYVCNPDDTLESVVLSIIDKISVKLDEFQSKYKITGIKFDISLFGMITAGINVENKCNNKFKTLTESFVYIIKKFCETYVEPHINIVIDELDQLRPEYNIAHFTKVILEKLDREGISALSFIFVGQNILFKRLLDQQPAFHRLVKHFALKPLDSENAEYVLDACLRRASVSTYIEGEAKEFLLKMSSGYPYSLQLLGHESFCYMLERFTKIPDKGLTITHKDFMNGLRNALVSEDERFKNKFTSLSDTEQQYIMTMANENSRTIPIVYKFNNIIEGIAIRDIEERKKQAVEVITSLCEKQILIEISKHAMFTNWEEKEFSFNEEIFRVYMFYKINNVDEIDYD